MTYILVLRLYLNTMFLNLSVDQEHRVTNVLDCEFDPREFLYGAFIFH